MPMPHFYFHLQNGKSRLEDRCGVSLPDAEAAWYQAYRSAREMLCAKGCGAGDLVAHALEIEDDRGAHVWTVPLAEIAGVAR
jgi:Domain of unknown function (DUF6894)